MLPTSHLAVLEPARPRRGPDDERARRRRAHAAAVDGAHDRRAREGGSVARRPDPDDGRQILVDLTKRGRDLLYEGRRRREDWLSQAIAGNLTAAEQKTLAQAIDLLHRLAEL